MDYSTLTDAQLDDQINGMLAERDRRMKLAAIPGQVSALAVQYKDGGGDVANLQAALV